MRTVEMLTRVKMKTTTRDGGSGGRVQGGGGCGGGETSYMAEGRVAMRTTLQLMLLLLSSMRMK